MSQRNRLAYETPNTVSDFMRVMRSAPLSHTVLLKPGRKFWNQFPELIHPVEFVSPALFDKQVKESLPVAVVCGFWEAEQGANTTNTSQLI